MSDENPRSNDAAGQDVKLLARSVIPSLTIFGEASDQPFEGKLGVGFVMAHRALAAKAYIARNGKHHPLFGDGTLASACTMHSGPIHQFSCWNDGADKLRMLAVTEETPGFIDCVRAAILAAEYRVPSPVGGALYYYNPNEVARTPAWAEGIPHCAIIGDHHFFDKAN